MTKQKRTPLYVAIAQELRQDIGRQAYAKGDRLPTEAELAQRFGVNRHTVRHAIGVLVDEGLVASRRGSGTTVVGKPLDYHLGSRVRFHQNVISEGKTPEKKVQLVEIQRATPDDARILKVPVGSPVCAYESTSFADGTPVAMVISRFPEHRLPGIADALLSRRSVTDALREVGIEDYTRRSTRFSAELATALQAIKLSIKELDPLLLTSSVNVDVSGNVVEFGRTWFVSRRITLVLE